jgi:hypothetical protein
MSVSIDIHEYNITKLYNQLVKITEGKLPEGRSVEEFFIKILPLFGTRYGDAFIVLWNEYYEDYNAGIELMRVASLYFGIPDVWLGDYKYLHSNMNAYEALENLKIEPIEVENEL